MLGVGWKWYHVLCRVQGLYQSYCMQSPVSFLPKAIPLLPLLASVLPYAGGTKFGNFTFISIYRLWNSITLYGTLLPVCSKHPQAPGIRTQVQKLKEH